MALRHPASREDGFGDGFHRDGDELINDDWEKREMEVAAASGYYYGNLPTTLTAKIKFGYETSMKDKLSSVGTDFNDWIDSVMPHVQTYYKHASFPTQVIFQVFTKYG